MTRVALALVRPLLVSSHEMDAAPLLKKIASAMAECGLEAVLIGNAAAALQGAAVTTLDFDFMFRVSASSVRKLKSLADKLGGTILRPYYPASSLYRLVNDEIGLQVDFMATIHGVRSFAALRSRATRLELNGATLLVASLDDIIRSKRAAGRPRDKAVLPVLEATRAEGQSEKKPRR